ncbi:hypothetical protein N8I77_010423 [Diaporthe amygdali]|uniref:2EXR domain-containing protein n=1 Tax=Phomopsis amygdali TaxID=1214568 RepID=A0AAD9W1T5_PHOAM|nr:hypothetical protein N8I77_010423 [Diaporthe amygdali]
MRPFDYNRATERYEALKTFHPYRKLPTELKFMIWEHTFPTQRRAIELQKVAHPYRGIVFSIRAVPRTPNVIKVALSVDRTSRALVFKNYVPLKLGLRIKPSDLDWARRGRMPPGAWYGLRDTVWKCPGIVGNKWLFAGPTVFMSERYGDTVMTRDRSVLIFPCRPAAHGLDSITKTYLQTSWKLDLSEFSARPPFPSLNPHICPAPAFTWSTGFTSSDGFTWAFFEKWWACLPQQEEERDSPPVGWEAEIDFWNSPKEHDVPYILQFRGRKPGACRRL